MEWCQYKYWWTLIAGSWRSYQIYSSRRYQRFKAAARDSFESPGALCCWALHRWYPWISCRLVREDECHAMVGETKLLLLEKCRQGSLLLWKFQWDCPRGQKCCLGQDKPEALQAEKSCGCWLDLWAYQPEPLSQQHATSTSFLDLSRAFK